MWNPPARTEVCISEVTSSVQEVEVLYEALAPVASGWSVHADHGESV